MIFEEFVCLVECNGVIVSFVRLCELEKGFEEFFYILKWVCMGGKEKKNKVEEIGEEDFDEENFEEFLVVVFLRLIFG